MDIDNYFRASKILSEDGVDGIKTATKLVGKEVAMALLIAHSQNQLGFSRTYPGDPQINLRIKETLAREGLLQINSFQGEYRFLSDFWLVDVEFEGEIYPSVEHAYQAAKTTNSALRRKIRNYTTPGDAKEKSTYVKVRPDWSEIKIDVMRSLLEQKFSIFKNPFLAQKLLATGDLQLIEGNTWHDTFWGVCDGVGENLLGIILMEIRENLRKQVNDFKLREIKKSEGREKLALSLNVSQRTLYQCMQIFNL